MKKDSLLKDFLSGNLAVLIDKNYPAAIYDFYKLIEKENFLSPGCWDGPPLEYLLDSSSGPYHFVDVEQHKLNGSGLNYILGNDIKYCYIDELLVENLFDEYSSEDKTDLDNAEYTNVLFGVV